MKISFSCVISWALLIFLLVKGRIQSARDTKRKPDLSQAKLPERILSVLQMRSLFTENKSFNWTYRFTSQIANCLCQLNSIIPSIELNNTIYMYRIFWNTVIYHELFKFCTKFWPCRDFSLSICSRGWYVRPSVSMSKFSCFFSLNQLLIVLFVIRGTRGAWEMLGEVSE